LFSSGDLQKCAVIANPQQHSFGRLLGLLALEKLLD
jgi:hypothetical protein